MEIIRVCADPFPPYQYIDDNGDIKGSDYEMVMCRLRAAGYDPKMCIAPWNQIYREFEAGERDVLFQAQDSPERMEKFYFSKLLRYAVTEVITKDQKLCELKTYSQLRNYKVGVIADFSNGEEIDSLPDYCKVEFADTDRVIQGVLNGEVDCGVCDQGVKEFLCADYNDLYSIHRLTYRRPLYVMFRNKRHRDDFDAVVI